MASKRDRGFSMVELVIVVAIFAITASFAVPAYLSWRDDSKVKGAAASMRADFERAKYRAIRENANVRVTFTTNAYMSHTDIGNLGVLDADEEVVSQATLPPGVTLSNNFGGDDVSFSPRGTAENGTVTMRSPGGREYAVVVSRFGRIRVQ